MVRMRERKEAERKSIYFAEGDSDILKYAVATSEKFNLSLSSYIINLIKKDKNKQSEFKEIKDFISYKFERLEEEIKENIKNQIKEELPF
jgi:uncharacterized protein (UPF0335 family)